MVKRRCGFRNAPTGGSVRRNVMRMRTLLLTMASAVTMWASRGTDLYQANQFAEAENALREEVSAQGDNWQTQYALGMTLLRLNKVNEAQEVLRKAATLNPDSVDPPLGLAEAAAHEKNFDEARQLVEEAAKIDKDSANLAYVRGVIKAGQRDFKGAVQDLEQATAKDDRNAYAHYYAGLSYNSLKRPDKMIEHFQKFMKLANKAPEADRVQSILRTAR